MLDIGDRLCYEGSADILQFYGHRGKGHLGWCCCCRDMVCSGKSLVQSGHQRNQGGIFHTVNLGGVWGHNLSESHACGQETWVI